MIPMSSLMIGILLSMITIWTIVGNILVILAFIIDKHIRQGGMSNYLIINLAFSDLLLGIAVLPFSASYSTFQIWYFGKVFCEIWLMIDVLCSTASIWVMPSFSSNLFPINRFLEFINHRFRSIHRYELSHTLSSSSSFNSLSIS